MAAKSGRQRARWCLVFKELFMKSYILSFLTALLLVLPTFGEPVRAEDSTGDSAGPAPQKEARPTSKKNKKEESGDTYNFYFQKGSGPGSVKQGDQPGQEVGAGAEQGASFLPEKSPSPRFEGHLGLMMVPAMSGLGLSLGGQFNATPNFGLQVHLLGLGGKDDDGDSSMSARGTSETSTKESSMGASFALAYSPITLNQRSMPIRLSAVGGFMFLSTSREETKHEMTAMGTDDSTTTKHDSKGLGFVGVSGLAMLNKSFGLVGYGHITSDPDYSQIGLSAAWLF
jgi:hypothetical protein